MSLWNFTSSSWRILVIKHTIPKHPQWFVQTTISTHLDDFGSKVLKVGSGSTITVPKGYWVGFSSFGHKSTQNGVKREIHTIRGPKGWEGGSSILEGQKVHSSSVRRTKSPQVESIIRGLQGAIVSDIASIGGIHNRDD